MRDHAARFHALPRLTGTISVRDSRSLDFEASPRLRLVVQAETPSAFGFTAVNLNLQDVNDNLPRFQLQNYVAFIWEAQGYDSPVIQVGPSWRGGVADLAAWDPSPGVREPGWLREGCAGQGLVCLSRKGAGLNWDHICPWGWGSRS